MHKWQERKNVQELVRGRDLIDGQWSDKLFHGNGGHPACIGQKEKGTAGELPPGISTGGGGEQRMEVGGRTEIFSKH